MLMGKASVIEMAHPLGAMNLLITFQDNLPGAF